MNHPRHGRAIRTVVFLVSLLAFAGLARTQSVSEQYLFAAANQDRHVHQLDPVRLDKQLSSAAHLHALRMAEQQDLSHRFQGEAQLATRAADAGVRFSLITENVAQASSAAALHDLWMHSPEHRANLLDPRVDSIGVGVVVLDGQLYAVEDFARTVRTLTLEQQEAAVTALVAKAGLQFVTQDQAARQTCAMATGFAGSRRPSFVMRYTSSEINELPAQLLDKLDSGKYHHALVGACVPQQQNSFASYSLAVLLYP